MRTAVPRIALSLALLAGAAPASGGLHADIDGEAASIDKDADRIHDGGTAFILDTESDGRQPWLSASTAFAGSHGIGFAAGPDADGRKERSEIVLRKDEDPGGLRLGETRHLAFALRPHGDTDADMEESVIIAQAAQRGHSPRGVGVIVYFQRTGGRPRIWLQTADPENNVWISEKVEVPHQAWSSVGLGITMKPGSSGPDAGRVRLFVDGEVAIDREQPLGYAVDATTKDTFKVACGIYSPRHSPQTVVLMMDDLRFGDTPEDVGLIGTATAPEPG